MRVPLKKRPLVEAIFELRWDHPQQRLGIKKDPFYKILIGTLYQSVKNDYPFLEQLDSANIPDEMANYIVQYRYRILKDKWPLIQIGPGIITLNDTDGYKWEDFEKRISDLLGKFFAAYPDPEKIKITDVLIRYIDSIDFDYATNDIFRFLKEKMKLGVDISDTLFQDTGVDKKPLGFDFKGSFKSTEPSGIINLRFAKGQRNNKEIVFWETVVQSIGDDAPKRKEEIIEWLGSAHWLADDWFFKIIEGDLMRRFE